MEDVDDKDKDVDVLGKVNQALNLEDVDDKDKDVDVLGKVNQALNESGLPQG